MTAELSLFLAFGAGFLSFISPCCLPLYPAFLSYITGMSVNELKNERGMMQQRAILHTIFFLLGFSAIFIALGFSTSLFSDWFIIYDDVIRQVGAIFIVFFGLVILGIFTPSFLMKDKKITFQNRPSGYFGTFIIGIAFAAGWTPCTGPITGAVYGLAATNPGAGVWYMLAYVLGFAIPFFVLSFFITRMDWVRRRSRTIMKVGGSVMIAVGVLLFFDGMTYLIRVMSPFFGGFQGL
ncbi:cytochrome c biogenesis CcdA family protein [Planococcus lenghuensis]|uniref:Cytochrome C biogenesis protein CcdA n=1 Tax=Planococcus lenghuensis TaxID=2213202 RepID=A0A1Q2L3P6_9BACL|nr:cytochrome c biogenesis protein CcdA [Planococcus lenghuensis]AQQ55049.1 cytochrome C biogenesis protein CcdA [Planococcus lenghuensis]